MPIDPYDVPKGGTVEYEHARRSVAVPPSGGGIMQYQNTSIGQGAPASLPVIGAIANYAGTPPPPPAPGPAPAPVPGFVPGPGGAPAPGGGVFGPILGGAPPIRNRYTGWATATQHVGWDPSTGAPVVTHLTGMNSPYPYVVKGGPAPFGTYSAPLLTMLIAGSQAGPRPIAPVAPKAAPGVGGGGPGTGGPGTGQTQTQTQASTEETSAAETPAAETPAADERKLKVLYNPAQDAQWYNEVGDPNEDYRVDLGDRIRYTAKQLGWPDWKTADEEVLAKRLQQQGFVIRDLVSQPAAQKLHEKETARDVYTAPHRDVNSPEFKKDLADAKDIYTLYRQQGYSHNAAAEITRQTTHSKYQNRLLDRSIDAYLMEQAPILFSDGGDLAKSPADMVNYYVNPQNRIRDSRNLF